MRFFSQGVLAAFALAASSQCVAGMSMFTTPLARDLRLSAMMGLDPDVLLQKGQSFSAMVANTAAATIVAEYATIPIDHNNSSVGTYQNRYWVNADNYSPGGPVFIYDVGESSADYEASFHLTNDTSFFKRLLGQYNAIGIVWEHRYGFTALHGHELVQTQVDPPRLTCSNRYYGSSLPFPVNTSTPAQDFQYLTNDQALADIPYFAKTFSRADYWYWDLTPRKTPWVMFGGSYSGMRAAFTRELYPDTIFAAYASSAPVEARVNMSSYFDQVYRGMNAYGLGNCTKDVHAALSYIDTQLSSNATAASIKQLFLGPGAELNNNGDFTMTLTGIFFFFQAYGIGGGSASLTTFCDWLETDTRSNSTQPTIAGANGLAPIYGSKYMAEKWAAWPGFVTLINSIYKTNCKGVDNTTATVCNLSMLSTDPDYISWDWQYCSQFGFFQIANLGPDAIISKYQSIAYQQQLCYQQFPDGVSSGFLPKQPQVDRLNDETGGWTMRPSNTYWTGGQFDPWRPLSPLSTESFAPQNVKFTTDIPACGVQTSENTLFGYIVPDAEHCFDFRTYFPGGDVARSYFTTALDQWLPCFRGQSSN